MHVNESSENYLETILMLSKKREIMPLTMANIGETNTIKRVSGNDETKRFLANLGFVPGAEVIVLSAIGGNVIVNIKDSRVAVNADMARHIMI